MTYREAAMLLVEMISDLRGAGYDRDDYHEAVAIANGVLYVAEVSDLCGGPESENRSAEECYDTIR